MVGQSYSLQQVEHLVRLVKKGDASSLAQARQELGKTQKEIALQVGVSERQLGRWEKGEQQPSRTHYVLWKLRLSDYVDGLISGLLGTNNMDVITRFWELIWELID